MKLANKVQEWVISKDIEHQFTVNEDDQTSMLKFSYLLNSQKFLGIIETDEQRDAIKAFIYAPFNVLPNKINEFCILLMYSIDIFEKSADRLSHYCQTQLNLKT